MRKRPRGEAGAEAGPSRSSADELLAERRRLPVWEARNAFLTAFSKTDTLVLTGETGCGKTTQIPQFLLAAGYAQHGAIGVTQPRRVAAMSVAQRVAYEQGEEVGGRVGMTENQRPNGLLRQVHCNLGTHRNLTRPNAERTASSKNFTTDKLVEGSKTSPRFRLGETFEARLQVFAVR